MRAAALASPSVYPIWAYPDLGVPDLGVPDLGVPDLGVPDLIEQSAGIRVEYRDVAR